MANEINVGTYVGIGDCIIAKFQLLDFVNAGNICNISPSFQIIKKYKNNPYEYFKFILSFMKLIFVEEGFNVTDTQFPLYDMIDLKKFGEPWAINLRNQLCDSNYLLPNELKNDKYIILHTKVRNYDEAIIDRNKLLSHIKLFANNHGYKIVAIGERKIGKNREYMTRDNRRYIFSIYDKIKNIFGGNFLDYTIEELGHTVPSLKNIINDCSLMSKAEFNICFGGGGQMLLSSSVGKIVYLADENIYKEFAENAFKETDNFVTTNVHSFINFFKN